MLYSKCTCCASNKNMLCCKKIHAVLKNYMLCDPGGLETRNENLAFMSMIKWRGVAKSKWMIYGKFSCQLLSESLLCEICHYLDHQPHKVAETVYRNRNILSFLFYD